MNLHELPTRIGLWPEFAELEGVKVPIRGSFLAPKMRRHLMRGGYERAERKLISRLIRPGDAVIELGASLGIISTMLARKVGPGGSVVSVEPNGHLRPHFERQLAVNGEKVRLISALGCPLWSGPVPEEVSRQRFAAVENSLSGRAAGADGTAMPWLSLKEIAEQAGIAAVTVLVIDVEGGEQVWCDHTPGFPKSVKTVIVEIHPHLIGEEKAGACVQALVMEGFAITAISGTVFGLTR